MPLAVIPTLKTIKDINTILLMRLPFFTLIAVCCTCAANTSASAQPPVVHVLPEPDTRADNPCPQDGADRFAPIGQINLNIRQTAPHLPPDCSASLFHSGPSERNWGPAEFRWTATNLYYQPLYFEETPLERYGQSRSPLLQPAISGAHFFCMFPIMPYKMAVDAPWDRVYTLGYYRPGSPAPCVHQVMPLELDASLIESGAWIGFILLLP